MMLLLVSAATGNQNQPQHCLYRSKRVSVTCVYPEVTSAASAAIIANAAFEGLVTQVFQISDPECQVSNALAFGKLRGPLLSGYN